MRHSSDQSPRFHTSQRPLALIQVQAVPVIGWSVLTAESSPLATIHSEGRWVDSRSNAPVIGITRDPASGGYWEVSIDGGVFAFDAAFYGAG